MSVRPNVSASHNGGATPPRNKHLNGRAGANMKGVSFMYELHKQLPSVPQETTVWLEIQ